ELFVLYLPSRLGKFESTDIRFHMRLIARFYELMYLKAFLQKETDSSYQRSHEFVHYSRLNSSERSRKSLAHCENSGSLASKQAIPFLSLDNPFHVRVSWLPKSNRLVLVSCAPTLLFALNPLGYACEACSYFRFLRAEIP